MGYFFENAIVVMKIIGPGPNALHEKSRFIPDYEYHEREIAKRYERSGRKWTYLGDWHSHPNQEIPSLSTKDRQTLKRIAKFKDARVSMPIMVLVTGILRELRVSAWQWQRGKAFIYRSGAVPVNVRIS